MPRPSERGLHIPLSPFRKLMPYADAAKRAGKKVYHLNIGQPDIETPPEALASLSKHLDPIVAYSPGVGRTFIREAYAANAQRRGIDIATDHIAITSGASEGLYFVMLACMQPGDNLIVPEPFYANYNGFAHMAGVKIKPIPTYIENEFRLPDISEFEALIDDRTRAILITNPNNPTGCVYHPQKLNQLAALAKDRNVLFIADEVYQDFCFGSEPFHSILNINNVDEHTLVLDSVSKKYSACGARIGFIITRNSEIFEVIERLAKLRLSPPAISEQLAYFMMQSDQEYLTESKNKYQNRRAVVYRRLQAMPGVISYQPGGAFYCFAKFPVDSAEHFCQWLLEEFDLQGNTVMVSPGQGFYATSGMGMDEIRIAFVLNEADLEKAMDCLEAGLKEYLQRFPSLLRNREMQSA